jgi:hypothetical protein
MSCSSAVEQTDATSGREDVLQLDVGMPVSTTPGPGQSGRSSFHSPPRLATTRSTLATSASDSKLVALDTPLGP